MPVIRKSPSKTGTTSPRSRRAVSPSVIGNELELECYHRFGWSPHCTEYVEDERTLKGIQEDRTWFVQMRPAQKVLGYTVQEVGGYAPDGRPTTRVIWAKKD